MIGTYHELLHLQSRYIKHPVTERKANTTNRKSRKSLVSVSSMVSVGLVVLLWPESLLLELLLMLMLLLLLRSRITTSLPGGCDIQCIFRAAAAVFYTCTEGRCFGACVIAVALSLFTTLSAVIYLPFTTTLNKQAGVLIELSTRNFRLSKLTSEG